MPEATFRNARIVLGDEIISGSLSVRDGTIDAFDHGTVAHGEDLEGDYLLPGLVELHTDHFENHYRPRPGVTWNALAALQSHDAQIAGAGARGDDHRGLGHRVPAGSNTISVPLTPM